MAGHSDYKRFERLLFEYLVDLAAGFIAVHYWHATVSKNKTIALVVPFFYCGLNVIYETLSIKTCVDHFFDILHSKRIHHTSYGTNIERLIVGYQDSMLVLFYLTQADGG